VLLADRALVLEEGRFILDLPIDLPRPRSAKDPRFAQHRERLLAALGVREDEPDGADEPVAEPAPEPVGVLEEVAR
jgi:sulfonate transport system ATP-binding protein